MHSCSRSSKGTTLFTRPISKASAALYWSFTEWGYYYMKPALGIEPYSVEAAEISLGYSFFHWGFATQAPYVLTGVAIGYAVYNRKVEFMKVSSVCEDMMGGFKYRKLLGRIIDISVVFCIVGALGCTLGLAVPLGTGALKQVFGIETTFPVQLLVVLGIAAVFTVTSFLGIEKGKKWISKRLLGPVHPLHPVCPACGPNGVHRGEHCQQPGLDGG